MKMSILSINGNKPFNYILQSILSKDYYVSVVSDPITGLKHMKANGSISLVIIDIDSFEDEALDFIEHINSSLLYQIPIFVLTSNPVTSIDQRYLDLKVSHFFAKPFNPLDLAKKVNEITLPIKNSIASNINLKSL